MKFFLKTGDVVYIDNAHYQSTSGEITNYYTRKDGDWLASIIQGNLVVTEAAQYRVDKKEDIMTIQNIEGRILSFDKFSYSEMQKIANFKKLLTRFSTRSGKLKK